MARMTWRTDEGWTTYGPPEDVLATDRIKGALDAAVHDCRLFARLAREARLQDLPTRLRLTWTEFCAQRLHQSPDVVEAMIAGIEVLGEDIPVPGDVATRVGQAVLDAHGGNRKRAYTKKYQGGPSTLKKNTAAHWLARLDRDQSPLAARVRAGELKAKTAARQAGIVRDKTPLEQLRHWWKKATPDERATFVREVTP